MNFGPAPLRPHTNHFYIGLDLGQRSDHSALVILERARHLTGRFDHVNYTHESVTRLYVRHAERFPLHFPYLKIPAAIQSTFDKLNPTAYESSPTPKTIVVDASGVGAPVVEIIHRAKLPAGVVPITITSGEKPNGNNIPRAALLSNLRILLETGILLISPSVPHYKQLFKELTGLSTLNRARHDDLAFALALAAWSARLTLPLPLSG
ncbi:MAG: hypothetical protein C0504_07820 [Candidatus Solibacter sp.]|nr:hypothetical protein [Candidatus Solibacter sp.]